MLTPEQTRCLQTISDANAGGNPVNRRRLARIMNGTLSVADRYLGILRLKGLIRRCDGAGLARYEATRAGLQALGRDRQYFRPIYCPECDGDVIPSGTPPVCPKHGRALAVAAE